MRRSSKNFAWYIKFVGRFYLAFFLLWLLLKLMVQDTLWWVAILNSFPFLVTFPAVVLAAALWWLKERKLALSLTILVVALFILNYGVLFWPNNAPLENGRSLSVATYNIKFDNEDDDLLVETIRNLGVEVVGLQEVTLDHTELFEEELGDLYPHRVFAKPEFESDVALLSKHPIVEIKPFTLQPRRMSMQVVLDVDGTLVEVFVVHMMPNQFTSRNGQPLNLHTRERFNLRRVEVTDLLLQLQHKTEHPAIVLCDCNFAETSEVYRMVARELNDVHREIGWGFGKTAWSELLVMPVMRVDYVWYSDAFTPLYTSFGERGLSNHRPVKATLVLGE